MPDHKLDSALSEFLFRHASLLLLVVDREGTILEANRHAERLTGRELSGGALSEVIVDFSGTFDLETAVNRKEAPQMWSVTTASGFPQTFNFHFVDQGERIVLIGEYNHRDSSLLEENLVRLNAEVGTMNRDLQKKTAELERINEVKNRFIGAAAHDLRNPIGAIHTLSDHLCRNAGTFQEGEEREVFSTIHESSGFMLSLIDDLLSVTTIESGEMRLTPEPADLNELVRTSVKHNQPVADKKPVRLIVQPDETLPDLKLDRMKIHQVLNNLISNAVKFSQPETKVVVSVNREGEHARVTVQDQGPGIPESDFGKLFRPFSRTSVQATGGEHSTGLGLTIAKRIVEGHNGSIWFDTEVGKGTAFHFSLPLGHDGHSDDRPGKGVTI